MTLHGLRRSFKSASEWLDIPNGIRQNIMGHVAKSTDEDYTIRPLDVLRVRHQGCALLRIMHILMIKIVTYQESSGRKPYADWLDGLTDNKAKARIVVRVNRAIDYLNDWKLRGKP